MRKLCTAILFLLSSNAFAFSAWIDDSSIPAPFLGQSQVSTQPNTGVIFDHDYGGKTRLNFAVYKYAYEDPIVFPGQARAGHLHMFFGNSCIDGLSTIADLIACETSTMIGGAANKSAYWMPAIIDYRDGKIQKPTQTLLYYTSKGINALQVQPFPEGLKIVAGDSKATGAPATVNKNYSMYCSKVGVNGTFRLDADGNVSTTVSQNQIPNCLGNGRMNLNFNFPNCWNGTDLDSTDHKSHMSYPLTNGTCPASHPVVLPIIGAVFEWTIVNDFDTKYWRLSSDMYDCNIPGGYTMHFDYWAGWMPKYMNMIVNNVLRPTKESGMGWIGVDPDTGIDIRFK
jgi:Domain of unknown function (DUF1996)